MPEQVVVPHVPALVWKTIVQYLLLIAWGHGVLIITGRLLINVFESLSWEPGKPLYV